MNDAGEWRLSPAYDLLYSFGPVNYGEHKMSINGKNSHIALADIAQCGYAAGLEKRFMVETIEEINSIFSTLTTKLQEIELSKGLVEEIVKEVKPLSIAGFPKSKRGRRSTSTIV